LHEDGAVGEAIAGQGKDISLNGIGFQLPCELSTQQALLHLPGTPQTPQMTVPVRIVRLRACGEGRFEVGAVLLPQGSEIKGQKTEVKSQK
jgi:hypothetical protein